MQTVADFFSPLDLSLTHQLMYWVPCRWMYVGVAQDVGTSEYASISLCIDQNFRHTMLWVCGGMSLAKQKPIVHLQEIPDGVRLTVLFQWTDVRFSSLQELFGHERASKYEDYARYPFEVVIPFFARFKPEQVALFSRTFKTSHRIIISLVETKAPTQTTPKDGKHSLNTFWDTVIGGITTGPLPLAEHIFAEL